MTRICMIHPMGVGSFCQQIYTSALLPTDTSSLINGILRAYTNSSMGKLVSLGSGYEALFSLEATEEPLEFSPRGDSSFHLRVLHGKKKFKVIKSCGGGISLIIGEDIRVDQIGILKGKTLVGKLLGQRVSITNLNVWIQLDYGKIFSRQVWKKKEGVMYDGEGLTQIGDSPKVPKVSMGHEGSTDLGTIVVVEKVKGRRLEVGELVVRDIFVSLITSLGCQEETKRDRVMDSSFFYFSSSHLQQLDLLWQKSTFSLGGLGTDALKEGVLTRVGRKSNLKHAQEKAMLFGWEFSALDVDGLSRGLITRWSQNISLINIFVVHPGPCTKVLCKGLDLAFTLLNVRVKEKVVAWVGERFRAGDCLLKEVELRLEEIYRGTPEGIFSLKITKEELLVVLNALQNEKIPGPDGWSVEFYLDFFELLGEDLLRVIEEVRLGVDSIMRCGQNIFLLEALVLQLQLLGRCTLDKITSPLDTTLWRQGSCSRGGILVVDQTLEGKRTYQMYFDHVVWKELEHHLGFQDLWKKGTLDGNFHEWFTKREPRSYRAAPYLVLWGI
eukprot:Gb_00828 [translate_table: standard]